MRPSLPVGLGALVLLKAADVALRGPQALPPLLWAAALGVWVAGGVLLVARERGWLLVLAGGLALAVDAPVELRRQHLVLLLGVALVGAVTRSDRERLLLLRTQLSALYGVAALAKLNEAYLSGTVLSQALLVPLPLPVVVAGGVALVATEVLLAVAPWVRRLRVAGTVVAAALHGTALLVVAGGPLVTLRLAVFGGTAVLLHAVSAGLVPVRRSAVRRP